MSVLEAITPFVAGLFAPQSIAAISNGGEVDIPTEMMDKLQVNLDQVQPGDLIFTSTPGFFFNTVRTMTKSSYDHVALVLNSKEVLHIGPSKVRVLSMYIILEPARKPFVLRPKFLSEKQRDEFLDNGRELIGQPYDTIRTYNFLLRLFLHHHFGVTLPMSQTHPHMICSDMLFDLLSESSPQFAQTARLVRTLDIHNFGSASLQDFINLSKIHPTLFKKVRLPLKTTPKSVKRTLDTEFSERLQEMWDSLLAMLPSEAEYQLRQLLEQFETLDPLLQSVISFLCALIAGRILKRILFGRSKL